MGGTMFWVLLALVAVAGVASVVAFVRDKRRYGNKFAPNGWVYMCTACGKRSRDRYGTQAIDPMWDESCMMHSVLWDESVAIVSTPANATTGQSEYEKLKVYSGPRNGCNACLHVFNIGEVITVADEGALAFCYTDGDGGCLFNFMLSLKPTRMLMGNPYVYCAHDVHGGQFLN